MTTSFFSFNDTATTEIYTLSLHDALPIYRAPRVSAASAVPGTRAPILAKAVSCVVEGIDRKSTRLNSSHQIISYAVFCLKKKKKSKLPRNEPRVCNHRCGSKNV